MQNAGFVFDLPAVWAVQLQTVVRISVHDLPKSLRIPGKVGLVPRPEILLQLIFTSGIVQTGIRILRHVCQTGGRDYMKLLSAQCAFLTWSASQILRLSYTPLAIAPKR